MFLRLIIIAPVLVTLLGAGELTAQQATAKGKSLMRLVHSAPKVEELPLPGRPLTLNVRLSGTKNTDLKLRTLVVRDGRTIDTFAPSAELNERDEPVYRISTYSPLAELSYQFVLYRENGSIEASPRYRIRRPCLPNVELTSTEKVGEGSGEARVVALVEQAKGLDRDLEAYERALLILDEIKTLVKE